MADLTIQISDPPQLEGNHAAVIEELNDLFGVRFQPIAPSPSDTVLATFFHAQVPEDLASSLVDALRDLPRIQAAYVKPPGRAPG
jgi:hypothetical protein